MLLICIFICTFMIFACFRIPVAISAALGGFIAMCVGGLNINMMPNSTFSTLDSFAFLAIPAFIYSGDLMTTSGISHALMGFIRAILIRLKGNVAATVAISSALFGTISGSSVATVSAIGSMMLPEMLKAGYEKTYSASLIAASGFLGILIPPSIPGVVYGIAAGQPIAQVWMSTASAGIMVTIAYIIYNRIFFAKQEIMPVGDFNFKEYMGNIKKLTPRALVALLMPIIIFVGVYGGILTPTEAGAVAVAYGLLAGYLIYPVAFHDDISDIKFSATVKKSAVTSATISMLIGFAAIASAMITYSGGAADFTKWMLSLTDNPTIFLLIINGMLIIVGMFMETNTSILLLAPILVPAAQAYGINPIHFGAIMLLNLEIGMITPPFASNLFVACKISHTTMDQLLKPILGFIAVCIPILLLITYCPALVMTPVGWFK